MNYNVVKKAVDSLYFVLGLLLWISAVQLCNRIIHFRNDAKFVCLQIFYIVVSHLKIHVNECRKL